MATTTNLDTIRTKVRRLTRSPSSAQLADSDIDQYVNTFVLYDFPEHLRTFNLRGTFTFYTNPLQDVYPTDTTSFVGVTTNPLYDFQNLYISIHPPVYIAGYDSFYTQSPEQFYGIYPQLNSIASIGTSGDGTTTTFSGVVNSQQSIVPPNTTQQICLVQNNVLFSSVNVNGAGLALIDVPLINPTTGNPSIEGNLYVPGQQPSTPLLYPTDLNPNNFINYLTGQFTITFPTAPGSGVTINSQTLPQVLALPQSMLYYDNQFTLRPVPDQPYRVNFEVYKRPTELLAGSQSPDLNEWWQYISYGASKKVFEDRMDLESVQLILPEYKKQETLCLRRTIVQNTNERVATIYTEQTNNNSGNGWGWPYGGGGSF